MTCALCSCRRDVPTLAYPSARSSLNKEGQCASRDMRQWVIYGYWFLFLFRFPSACLSNPDGLGRVGCCVFDLHLGRFLESYAMAPNCRSQLEFLILHSIEKVIFGVHFNTHQKKFGLFRIMLHIESVLS